jgi:hypothetical protein
MPMPVIRHSSPAAAADGSFSSRSSISFHSKRSPPTPPNLHNKTLEGGEEISRTPTVSGGARGIRAAEAANQDPISNHIRGIDERRIRARGDGEAQFRIRMTRCAGEDECLFRDGESLVAYKFTG